MGRRTGPVGRPLPPWVRHQFHEAGPSCSGCGRRPACAARTLQPFVDAVRRERDDAVGVGRPDGGAELLERPRKRAPRAAGNPRARPPGSPSTPGPGRGAGRRARAARRRSRPAPRSRRAGGLRRTTTPTIAATIRARLAARRLGLEPAPAPAAFVGGEHQLAGLARRRPGLAGVLARDAAQRVGDGRRLRRVRPARPRGRRRRSPRPRSGP